MTDRQLVSGAPVPEDSSHTTPKANGQQQDYVVLTPEERAKGFVKPLRLSYLHAFPTELERAVGCGTETRMGQAIAETYARDPRFYSGTFCCGCRQHFPLNQFIWAKDGEPMDPDLQDAWNAGRAEREAAATKANRRRRIDAIQADLHRLRTELATLETQEHLEATREQLDG